ncbi:MAG: hypothetical protein Q8S94_09040 [Pseudohongiella sp.]|nr:hypothetical protein [Pseudohongiella sp.]
MSRNRLSLTITLILCLMLQGSGLSFASAKGVADCGMDMQQMEMMWIGMQQEGHDHSAMHDKSMPPASMDHATHEQGSVDTDCCDVDNITRSDCISMPDCHSLSR